MQTSWWELTQILHPNRNAIYIPALQQPLAAFRQKQLSANNMGHLTAHSNQHLLSHLWTIPSYSLPGPWVSLGNLSWFKLQTWKIRSGKFKNREAAFEPDQEEKQVTTTPKITKLCIEFATLNHQYRS